MRDHHFQRLNAHRQRGERDDPFQPPLRDDQVLEDQRAFANAVDSNRAADKACQRRDDDDRAEHNIFDDPGVGRIDARHHDIDADMLVGAEQMRRHEESGNEQAVFGQLDQPGDRGNENIRRITSALMPSRHGGNHNDGQHAKNAHQPAVEPEDQAHARDVSNVRWPDVIFRSLSITALQLADEVGTELRQVFPRQFDGGLSPFRTEIDDLDAGLGLLHRASPWSSRSV